MRISSCIVLTLLASASLPAQDVAKADKALRFKVAEDGQILMSPDPAVGGANDKFTPLVDPTFMRELSNGGITGWLAIAYQGNTDIASMADSAGLLTRLGRAGDQSLLQAIGKRGKLSHHENLLRLMAIRVAQDRVFKPAIGALERALESGIDDALVRQAARDAIATLRGESPPLPEATLPNLASVLAEAPADLDLVLQLEHFRLPPGRALLRWGRQTGLAITKREIKAAGGAVSPAQWAGAVMLAQGPAAAPYELARRFGNHRFDRHIMAVGLPKDGAAYPPLFMRFDGTFDVARVADGLDEAGVPLEGDDQRITCQLPGGGTLELSTKTATIRAYGAEKAEKLGIEKAHEMAKGIIASRAPVVIQARSGLAIPDELQQLEAFGMPRRISLWPPTPQSPELRVQIVCDSERSARTIEAQAKDLDRLFEQQIENLPNAGAFDPLLEALEAMKVVRDGTTVDARLPTSGLDVEKLMLAAAKSL